MLNPHPYKKIQKFLPKVIGRKLLGMVIKVNYHFLHEIIATFSTDSKSASNSAFFIPILNVRTQKYWALLAFFVSFETEHA
jgi:hypothetical protein